MRCYICEKSIDGFSCECGSLNTRPIYILFVEDIRKIHHLFEPVEIYGAITNRSWKKTGVNGREYEISFSWRMAGDLVVKIYNRGNYMTYYCSGNEGCVPRLFKDLMEEKGWK